MSAAATIQEKRTLACRIRLHELVRRAGFRELRGEPCQLRQDLVHQPDLAGEVVLVDVQGEKAADVACANAPVSTTRLYIVGLGWLSDYFAPEGVTTFLVEKTGCA